MSESQGPGELLDEHLKKHLEVIAPGGGTPSAGRVRHFESPEVDSGAAQASMAVGIVRRAGLQGQQISAPPDSQVTELWI